MPAVLRILIAVYAIAQIMVFFWESKPSLNFVSNQWIAWQQEVYESSVSPSFHHSSSFQQQHHHQHHHHHSNNNNNIIINIIIIINTYNRMLVSPSKKFPWVKRDHPKGFFCWPFSDHSPVGSMGISISRYWFMLIYGFVNQSNPYQPYLLVYIDIDICYQYKSHVHKSTCIAAWDIFCLSPLEFMKQTSLFSYSVFSVFSQFFQDESQSLTNI